MSLVYQWYALLTNAFQTEIGVYYSGEKRVLPLTVTTYHSAGDLIAEYGNTFKLLICDEEHHLPAKTWGEAALMAPAPFRLGLTATYPEEHEQIGERWRLDELIGPIVYTQRLETLVGKQLAAYRTQRVRVDLSGLPMMGVFAGRGASAAGTIIGVQARQREVTVYLDAGFDGEKEIVVPPERVTPEG